VSVEKNEEMVENGAEVDFEIVKSAVLSLLKVTNSEEALVIIQQQPALLTPQAEQLFELLINNAQAQGKETFVVILTGLRELVQNYRQFGAKAVDDKASNTNS